MTLVSSVTHLLYDQLRNRGPFCLSGFSIWVVTPKKGMIPNWQLWEHQIRPVNLVLVVVL